MTAGLLLVSCLPVEAQTTVPARPFRAVFGALNPSTAAKSFDFTLSTSAGYDDDILAVNGPSLNPATPPMSGQYSMLSVGADYRHRERRFQFGASGSSALRYYGQLDATQVASGSASVGLSASMTSRTNVFVNQSVSYSPSYLYGVFPSSEAPTPGYSPTISTPDYSATNVESYSYDTAGSITHRLGGRATLSIDGDIRYTDFVFNLPNRRDTSSFGTGTKLIVPTTRNTDIRLDYHFRSGDLGFGDRSRTSEHAVEFGFDLSRRLSATRRAFFSASAGPSLVNVPASLLGLVNGTDTADTRRLYRASGSVAAGYQFLRTWEFRGNYRRGLEYIPGLAAPVLGGSFSTSLEGMFSRRLDFHSSGGYSSGDSAVQNLSTYTTYTGDLRLQFAISRTWAVYGEYLYYYYDFSGIAQLLPGLASGLERNGLRAGLTLWLPLIDRR